MIVKQLIEFLQDQDPEMVVGYQAPSMEWFGALPQEVRDMYSTAIVTFSTAEECTITKNDGTEVKALKLL